MPPADAANLIAAQPAGSAAEHAPRPRWLSRLDALPIIVVSCCSALRTAARGFMTCDVGLSPSRHSALTRFSLVPTAVPT